MSLGAHLTILWDGTSIGSARLAPGQAVGIVEGGVIAPLSGRAVPVLIVRMHARGASVSRPQKAACGAVNHRWVIADDVVEIALDESSSTSVYRRQTAPEQGRVVLRLAVSPEAPRRLGWLPPGLRLPGALGFAVALHCGALAMARAAIPPLQGGGGAPFEDQRGELPAFSWIRVAGDPLVQRKDDALGPPEVCQEPIRGRSTSVQGPRDNPDPHVARYSGPERAAGFDDVIGPTRPIEGWDAKDPWGWDDALGADPVSSVGTPRGAFGGLLFDGCFGTPPQKWPCAGSAEPPEPATPATLGLAGIGEEVPPNFEQRRRFRVARVTVGPIALDANVPRWAITSSVRDAVDRSLLCYQRARADDPALAGRLDAVLKVRGDVVSVDLHPSDGMAGAAGLRCCVAQAHNQIPEELPRGARATALYSITFDHHALP